MLTFEEQEKQSLSVDLNLDSNFNTTTILKPFLIVDINFVINFLNNSAQNSFNLSDNSTLGEINSDPSLINLLEDFQLSGYKNLSLDVRIFNKLGNSYSDFTLEVESAEIENSKYYFLIFTPSETNSELAGRINSIHAAIEFGNLPVMIVNTEAKITFLSKAFEDLIENTIEKLYRKYFGAAFVDLLTKEDLFAIENAYLEKRKWSKVVTLVRQKFTTHYEIQFNPVSTLDRKSDFYMVIANDITDHIEKNILVQQSENKLKNIIDNINDPLLIVRLISGNLIFEIANNSFYRVFNFKKDDIQGVDISAIFNNDFLRKIIENCKRLIKEKQNLVEYGSAHQFNHYQVKISEMEIEESKEKFICISMINDTEQQNYHNKIKAAYKKEVQLNELKTNFIENISHEIRTPFNAIAGYADIIEDSLRCKDYDSISELIVLVKEVLSRVSGLFDLIIEMSELESGDIKFNYVHLNCNQVLKSVHQKLEPRANQKGINLELKIPDEEIMIKVDWLKLEKIIYALTENSIKYTHYGKVILRSFMLNDFAYITITDTGEGMNQEDVEKLLKPFSQEEEGYTRNYQGAGLGLTVASRLTKLMGGIFDIVSSKQNGTKVILSFPLVKIHPDN